MSTGTQQFWFNYSSLVEPVLPNALIQAWYDALAVKPSNPLTTALNELSQGLDDDGNWSKLDLFGLLGGMETQEQQLKPLITTSGDDFTIEGAPVLNSNGARNDGGLGYLDLKWNPTDDGTQYTLNSAFISTYIGNFPAAFDLGTGSIDTLTGGLTWLYFDGSGGVQTYINLDQSDTPPSSVLAESNFYAAGVINGGNLTSYANAVTDTVVPTLPLILPTYDFFGCDSSQDGGAVGSPGDAYFRHFMFGAGTADQAQIMARLNTYYAARGL